MCEIHGYMTNIFVFFFFFQAEDGIRDKLVTGVQTCALPISFNLSMLFEVLGRAAQEHGTIEGRGTGGPDRLPARPVGGRKEPGSGAGDPARARAPRT